jgi:hypothetical protein
LQIRYADDGRILLKCWTAGCKTKVILAAIGIPADALRETGARKSTLPEELPDFGKLADDCYGCLRPIPAYRAFPGEGPFARSGMYRLTRWEFASDLPPIGHARERYATRLGVDVTALEKLRCGYATRAMLDRQYPTCYTFPMSGADGVCCGIRLRGWDGEKKNLAGSKLGLFRPTSFYPSAPFLVCEGPTDTAAALSLDFNCIGRASAKSTGTLIQELVRDHQPEHVCFVADNDEVGLSGAHELAQKVIRFCDTVRIIQPPTPCKDPRAWLHAHATAADVRRRIRHTRPIGEEPTLWQK